MNSILPLALDVHELYQQTLLRSLRPEELVYLDGLIEKYPYFSLPRWLKLQHQDDASDTFSAALRVGKRQQLQKFLHERLYFAEISLRATMADQTDHNQRNIWFPPFPFRAFSILHEKPVANSLHSEHDPLSIPYPISIHAFPFLESTIEEVRQRYKYLTQDIRTHIRIPVNTTDPQVEPDKGKTVDQLVDRFLDNLPTITPARPKEEKVPDEIVSKAKASVSGSQEFVSETLAKLHLRQGNYVEARRMYELLRLRFPEKSDYFAAQLDKIKES